MKEIKMFDEIGMDKSDVAKVQNLTKEAWESRSFSTFWS